MGFGWGRSRRAGGYLLVALGSGMLSLVMVPLTVVAALTVLIGGLGLLLVPRWLGVVRRWAGWHHRRAARLLGIPAARVPGPEGKGLGALLKAPATRRDLVWLVLFSVTGVVAGLTAVVTVGLAVNVALLPFWWVFPEEDGLGVFGVPVTGWGTALVGIVLQVPLFAAMAALVLPPVARALARMNFRLLAPSEAELLAGRVDELARTRADVVDAHGAELRRIERDLHDGTQARLVSIAMQLGVAREAVEDPRVATLLRNAHTGTEEAMTELRDVIRSIYPPILADRGLVGALRALAARTTVPVRLDAGELGTLPVATETAAYFVVTETVANAVRHSGASTVWVRLAREDGLLRVGVHDDGAGGVDESRGSGVVGIRRRVAALDGTVRVASPVGGPTRIDAELPCGS
ncbi:signal transduction histidine kinase [Nocardiopsis sp. Huas11]|uniref:sensor histidine kinase n=1 Tax=Nocardiopsis sp. Huas11 TaxID=2183912 RepID=UPI000EAB94FE|nr:sensor histidine kinase [Nocardiopsis sp. Huas11]RKS10601.1 signal transduction histidine kinase [Nocardiopsis sp. Huas11]